MAKTLLEHSSVQRWRVSVLTLSILFSSDNIMIIECLFACLALYCPDGISGTRRPRRGLTTPLPAHLNRWKKTWGAARDEGEGVMQVHMFQLTGIGSYIHSRSLGLSS